jgi:hypothetical protein
MVGLLNPSPQPEVPNGRPVRRVICHVIAE